MKPETNQFRPGRIIIYVLSVFLIFGMSSCNPKASDSQLSETAKNDSTPPPQEQQTKKAFLGDGKFAYLAITKDSLDKFFILTPPQGGLKARKIVFRFSHDGMEGTNLVIDGFLTRSNNINYLDRPPVFLLPALANGSENLSGQKIYLSDLEMTSAQYTRFIQNSSPKKFLVFIPYIIGNTSPKEEHCVNYWMFWLDNIGALVAIPPRALGDDNSLNPSPPADPGP